MKHSRALLSRLPGFLKGPLFRQRVRLAEELPQAVSVSVARNQRDLEASFRLVHDAYVESEFMKPTVSGLRVTKYHALPTTSVLVLKWEERVIGTASVVQDSPFGLPMDEVFDLSRYRKGGRRIAEISSLAIDPEFRGRPELALFPLTKYIYNYCDRFLRLDTMCCAVNPRHRDLYGCILMFDRLSERPAAQYAFANNQPAVGYVHDFARGAMAYARAYSVRRSLNNLFRYFFGKTLRNLKFPNRRVFRSTDPAMTAEQLHYFFNQRSHVFRDLSPFEQQYLKVLYPAPIFQSILPSRSFQGGRFPSRRESRHPVSMNGVLYPAGKRPRMMKVRDLSLGGFQGWVKWAGMEVGERVSADIQVAPKRTLRFSACVRWRKGWVVGFSIDEAPDGWREVVRGAE